MNHPLTYAALTLGNALFFAIAETDIAQQVALFGVVMGVAATLLGLLMGDT